MIGIDDPFVQSSLISVPNKEVFSRPMSKKARILLNGIMKWACHYAGKCYKGNSQPTVECFKAFIAEYRPIVFEDAVHRFDMATYITALNKNFSPNKPEGLLDLMLLRNLDNRTWVDEQALKHNPNKVSSLYAGKTEEVYEWLSTHFLLTDFTEMDLNKIAEMGSQDYPIQTIKDSANSILDNDKKNIAYLYAIVKDVTTRERVVREKERSMNGRYEERLRQLVVEAQTPKQQHQIDDKTAQWERDREYIELMRDLDKNE